MFVQLSGKMYREAGKGRDGQWEKMTRKRDWERLEVWTSCCKKIRAIWIKSNGHMSFQFFNF